MSDPPDSPDSEPPVKPLAEPLVEVNVRVPEGLLVRVTVEAMPGQVEAGAIPEEVGREERQIPRLLLDRVFRGDGTIVSASTAPSITRARVVRGLSAWPYSLDSTLFFLALLIYLSVRLIGLANFPIYFFTDEAIQTVMAADFIKSGFKNYNGEFLPTYFNRDATYNLSSISVYLQVIPYLLFGKSVFVTRAVSVLVATFGAAAVGLTLRDIFRVRYWWSGVLLLSIAPAWFLHSRTAFESVEMVSFYAGFLYFYLLYRTRDPRHLYLALVLGAFTFYTYSPGQLIMITTGVLFLITDLRYHWQQRAVGGRGMLLLAVLVLPFLRFYLTHPNAPIEHLTTRAPFWMTPVPLSEKVDRLFEEYLHGLSPAYWFIPNNHDLDRHLMKGYGHLMLATLPLFLLGLIQAIRRVRNQDTGPAYRAVLLTLLAAPSGCALVGVGITRILNFLIPATILITFGLVSILGWAEHLRGRQRSTGYEPGNESSAVNARNDHPSQRRPVYPWVENLFAISLMFVLALINFIMLRDALVNGPLWYQDYTLGGMQYGARQLFPTVQQFVIDHPGTEAIVSPSWTNGADAVAQFFLPEGIPVRLGSIEGYLFQHLPLGEQIVFVMIPSEFEKMQASGKFQQVKIEKILPYPNGKPGFYFVRLHYVDNILAILAAEKEQRRALLEDVVTIDGQAVQVRYSMLDMATIHHIFDGDDSTVARTLEANPFVIELVFPELRKINGIRTVIGSLQGRLTVKLYATPGTTPIEYVQAITGSVSNPQISLDFGEAVPAQIVRLEFYDPNAAEPAHIHVWEIEFY